KALNDFKPDLVAIPGWSSTGALAALGWTRRRSIPAILMSASTARDRRRRAWREKVKRRIVGLCSAGIAGGRLQSDYLAALSLPRHRIFEAYDSVDNDYFIRTSDASRRQAASLRRSLELPERYFLVSSRFVPKKNLPCL